MGNWIQPKNCTATLGTFTLAARPGRIKQILKTVRYSYVLDDWVNKIGLRNPGFDSILTRNDLKDKIISIHGFNTEEWLELFSKIEARSRRTWETNCSCPNVTDAPLDYAAIFDRAKKLSDRHSFIVKLPPVRWEPIFNAAIGAGLTNFHCCNTLPTQVGGLSGPPLKPHSLAVIREIRKNYPHVFIIGGGGVRTKADMDDYHKAGANRVAMASGLFNPFRTLLMLQSLAAYADRLFRE